MQGAEQIGMEFLWDCIPPGLFRYGIFQDKSDFRIHVGFRVNKAFIFPTREAEKAARSSYPSKFAGQPGVEGVTGIECMLHPQAIMGCHVVEIPKDLGQRVLCKQYEDTSIKGRKAVQIAKQMIRDGFIAFPEVPLEVSTIELQQQGIDLLVVRNLKIQIKCDYFAGYNGRGLFIQTHERNPLKKY